MDLKTCKTLENLHNLYKRPGTSGEKVAARAAIERINKRLPKHEQLDLNPKSTDDMNDDDLLKELGIDLDGPETKLSDGSSIFKTKEQMRDRWAKMAKDSKARAKAKGE